MRWALHLPFILTAATLGACTGSPVVEQCPDGTTRAGRQCIPNGNVAVAPPTDAGPRPDATTGGPDDAGGADSGEPVEATLPFFVEQFFVMSGFFSESNSAQVVRADCTGVTGTAPGATCMQIDFDPSGDAWGGFFFQSPADNWGALPGLAVPAGAQQIKLRAWGAVGGETVKFGAGIDNEEPNEDGWHSETNLIVLGTEPTDYFVDLRSVTYDEVVGGFMWVAETPDKTTPIRFFIDNIEWSTDDPAVGAVALPFWVDDHYAMSGYFPGPPGVPEIAEDCTAAGTDPASVCRRITFTPNGGTFGGFFFQNPADNWGAEPGLQIAPGAQQIRFRAWGAAGGESLKFGAGINNAEPNSDGWNIENPAVALTTAPTEYTVDLRGVTYDRVVGGFLWVVETPDGTTPRTFFLDNVRWE